MDTAIWWIRRDLRLSDNQALTAALEQAVQVVPAFILDPALLNSPYVGQKRLAFLLASLRQLAADLEKRGSRLIVRRGDPCDELTKLLTECEAEAIFAEADHSPYARTRDDKIADTLPLSLVGGVTLYPTMAVLKDDDTPYTVYTPYSKQWKSLPRPDVGDLLEAPAEIPTPEQLTSEAIPETPALPADPPFAPSEAAAAKQLSAFVDGEDPPIYRYSERRDRPDLDGTSQISPYLRFGLISARQAVVAALTAQDKAPNEAGRKGAETWLNELIWREFYIAILYHFPHVRRRSFRSKYDDMAWENDEANFKAWCNGQTGYPIVDAAMRQLKQLGWMHNRTRMIVASFLVKDLLIDWRWGERWFMQHLIDGDPAANNGGWQWTAGTGTDAAPYFRVFNPTTQSKKYDPDGDYIRRWVPELANVPPQYIHEPAQMPADVQQKAGCIIGQDYPNPIIDHAAARERALEVYGQTK